MITKNFKAIMATLLVGSETDKGRLPIRWKDNNVYYLKPTFNNFFPYQCSYNVLFDNMGYDTGVQLGSGTTPPTENDYILEHQILSGLTAVVSSNTTGVDSDGNYYRDIVYAITNTSNQSITISEVGFWAKGSEASAYDGTNIKQCAFLIDRTLLTAPITIEAGEAALLKYTLKTVVDL